MTEYADFHPFIKNSIVPEYRSVARAPAPACGDIVVYCRDIGDRHFCAYDQIYEGTGIPTRAAMSVTDITRSGFLRLQFGGSKIMRGPKAPQSPAADLWPANTFLFLGRPRPENPTVEDQINEMIQRLADPRAKVRSEEVIAVLARAVSARTQVGENAGSAPGQRKLKQ